MLSHFQYFQEVEGITTDVRQEYLPQSQQHWLPDEIPPVSAATEPIVSNVFRFSSDDDWRSFRVKNPAAPVVTEIKSLEYKCGNFNWDGEGGYPVAKETILIALSFIDSLPEDITHPEVSVDPDGEIALDWFGMQKKILSISIGPTGEINYAVDLGIKGKKHGQTKFIHDIPDRLITYIRQTMQ